MFEPASLVGDFPKRPVLSINFVLFLKVVNCICEFVEGSQIEIRSGWRPLFRALGGVSSANHVNSLLEVFQVFLDTGNPAVFSNAAMDFIHCLMKHIRGNGKFICVSYKHYFYSCKIKIAKSAVLHSLMSLAIGNPQCS